MEQEQMTTPADDFTIYRHDECPEWGNAIMAWARGKKRGYQFEDGKLRVFKKGWFDKLSEVDLPAPKAAATAERLQRKLGLTPRRVKASNYDGISFDDQLLLFAHFYPDSFQDDEWKRDKRGIDASKRLKRHRDAAIADAQETLSKKNLDAWIASEQFDAAWDSIHKVLKGTDLVTSAHLKSLKDIDADGRKELTLRTRGLLWGDETYEVRFERFIAALALVTGKQPPWQLATVLSALVHPDEHMCIRPSSIRAQASYMAPRLRLSNTPSAPLYMRMLNMINLVRTELTDADMKPRDMLDVHDFMWTTLRPKARKMLDELKSDDSASAVA